MLLVSQLIEEVRDELHGEFHQTWNVVSNGPYTSSATTVRVADVELGLGVGSVFSVEGTHELVYVRDINTSTNDMTVIRGFRGTTAAAIPNNERIEVNPRFPVVRIRRAIGDEIRSWPATLFVPALEEKAVADGGMFVQISRPDAYRVLDMRRAASDTLSTRDTYPRVPGPWEIVRAAPGAKAGYGVQFGGCIPDGKVFVLYAMPFVVPFDLDDSLDLQDDLGLAEGMNEIVRWGVMWRMASREEFDRTDLSEQGQPRRAEEVAPGQIPSFARYCKQMRDQRIAQEADRLRALYPVTRL